MIRTWQVELKKWQNATALMIFGDPAKKRRLAATPAHYHIINYESLGFVEHNQYAGIIFDEIHRCANATTQFERALALSQRSQKRLGLSGSPITNDLESIFNQMLIIDHGRALGPSRTRFLERFFNTSFTAGGYRENTPKDDSVAGKISEAIAESMYFVKKEEALPFLPEKTHTPIFLDMTDEQAAYYKSIKTQLVTYIQDAEVTIEQASAKVMKLLQICAGFVLTDDHDDGGEPGRHFSDIKTQTLMDLLKGELAGRKVIVWTLFRYESRRLAHELQQAGISHIRMDGSISSQKDRDAMVDRWNNDPNLLVMARQISMSEGVTLHAKDCPNPCHDTIYMSLSWRLTDWAQSQDRIHRIGQKYHCGYRYLLTSNGYDRQVYESVLDKNNVSQAVKEQGKAYYLKLLQQIV